MVKLQANETVLIGEWQSVGDRVVGNEACERIHLLTSQYLERVATDPSGWDKLYRDPGDERYWELTYPHSDWHGGGPPFLQCISLAQARATYGPI